MMIMRKLLQWHKSKKLEGMKLQYRNRRQEEQLKNPKKHLNPRLMNQQKLQQLLFRKRKQEDKILMRILKIQFNQLFKNKKQELDKMIIMMKCKNNQKLQYKRRKQEELKFNRMKKNIPLLSGKRPKQQMLFRNKRPVDQLSSRLNRDMKMIIRKSLMMFNNKILTPSKNKPKKMEKYRLVIQLLRNKRRYLR
jgi:hypothetical protein